MCKGAQNRRMFCSGRNLESNPNFLATTTYSIWRLLPNPVRRSTLLAKICNLSKFRYAFSSRNLWVEIPWVPCQTPNYQILLIYDIYNLNISRFQPLDMLVLIAATCYLWSEGICWRYHSTGQLWRVGIMRTPTTSLLFGDHLILIDFPKNTLQSKTIV
jgi:hypothetical protein